MQRVNRKIQTFSYRNQKNFNLYLIVCIINSTIVKLLKIKASNKIQRAYLPGVARCSLLSQTFARPFPFLLLVLAGNEVNFFDTLIIDLLTIVILINAKDRKSLFQLKFGTLGKLRTK